MVNHETRGLLAVRIASGLLVVALLFWAFQRVDFARVGESIAGVGALGFGLIATPQLLSLCLECLGWSRVFRVLGRRVSPRPLLRVRLATEALAQTLPLGVIWSEALKPLLLERHAGLSGSESVAAIVARKYLLMASQAVYVAVLSACGFATLRRLALALTGRAELAWSAFAVSALLCLLALGVSGTFTHGHVAARVLGLLRRLPSQRLRAQLSRQAAAFASADSMSVRYFGAGFVQTTLAPGLFFLCGWCCESLESYLILRLLGVELDFFAVASLEVMLSFLKNVLFFLPAGIGVQDIGYVSGLTALGVPDALNLGAAFSVLKRGKELLWASLGYLLLAAEARPAVVAPRLRIDVA